jgi:hypothetical protein
MAEGQSLKPRTVLIAIDGSEYSKYAFDCEYILFLFFSSIFFQNIPSAQKCLSNIFFDKCTYNDYIYNEVKVYSKLLNQELFSIYE